MRMSVRPLCSNAVWALGTGMEVFWEMNCMVWASVSLVEGVDLMHSLGEMKITDPGDLYHFWTCRFENEVDF